MKRKSEQPAQPTQQILPLSLKQMPFYGNCVPRNEDKKLVAQEQNAEKAKVITQITEKLHRVIESMENKKKIILLRNSLREEKNKLKKELSNQIIAVNNMADRVYKIRAEKKKKVDTTSDRDKFRIDYIRMTEMAFDNRDTSHPERSQQLDTTLSKLTQNLQYYCNNYFELIRRKLDTNKHHSSRAIELIQKNKHTEESRLLRMNAYLNELYYYQLLLFKFSGPISIYINIEECHPYNTIVSSNGGIEYINACPLIFNDHIVYLKLGFAKEYGVKQTIPDEEFKNFSFLPNKVTGSVIEASSSEIEKKFDVSNLPAHHFDYVLYKSFITSSSGPLEFMISMSKHLCESVFNGKMPKEYRELSFIHISMDDDNKQFINWMEHFADFLSHYIDTPDIDIMWKRCESVKGRLPWKNILEKKEEVWDLVKYAEMIKFELSETVYLLTLIVIVKGVKAKINILFMASECTDNLSVLKQYQSDLIIYTTQRKVFKRPYHPFDLLKSMHPIFVLFQFDNSKYHTFKYEKLKKCLFNLTTLKKTYKTLLTNYVSESSLKDYQFVNSLNVPLISQEIRRESLYCPQIRDIPDL